jgi:FkbM family methyltransferase
MPSSVEVAGAADGSASEVEVKRLTHLMSRWRGRISKLRAILVRPEYARALMEGVAASVEHDTTPLRHDYLTVLDVGANRGQFALVAARRFPRASLFCFEPQPGPRAMVSCVMRRHPRTTVMAVALGETSGTAVLYLSKADDSSALRPSTQLQTGMFRGTEVVGQLEVVTERLDALLTPDELKPPVLLKIDVQGAELDVLRGASGLLPYVATVLVECSFAEFYVDQALADEVIVFLYENGFRIAHVGAPTLGPGQSLLQADFTFERP